MVAKLAILTFAAIATHAQGLTNVKPEVSLNPCFVDPVAFLICLSNPVPLGRRALGEAAAATTDIKPAGFLTNPSPWEICKYYPSWCARRALGEAEEATAGMKPEVAAFCDIFPHLCPWQGFRALGEEEEAPAAVKPEGLWLPLDICIYFPSWCPRRALVEAEVEGGEIKPETPARQLEAVVEASADVKPDTAGFCDVFPLSETILCFCHRNPGRCGMRALGEEEEATASIKPESGRKLPGGLRALAEAAPAEVKPEGLIVILCIAYPDLCTFRALAEAGDDNTPLLV